jgi:hypothetical protein
LARCRARVAAASHGLPTEFAESGGEEELESNASDWRFVVMVLNVRAEGELGMLEGDWIEGDLRFILTSSVFHLALHGAPDGRAQKSSHGVCPGHLLQNSDEEVDRT